MSASYFPSSSWYQITFSSLALLLLDSEAPPTLSMGGGVVLTISLQPVMYVAHLIGHEGPGSLLSYLKVKGQYVT